MRVVIYCFILIAIVTSCISSLLPTKPPEIIYTYKPQTDVLEVQPLPPEPQTNQDHAYQEGYLARQDEIDE
jgi:hypothetical protein